MKTAPNVSHLFFADDLLLFRDTSIGQARIMEEISRKFCGESGQKVNLVNSKIWFSPNTLSRTTKSIVSQFGIKLATNLGVYLGKLAEKLQSATSTG